MCVRNNPMFILIDAIKSGKLTINDVPTDYKVQVQEKLNEQ